MYVCMNLGERGGRDGGPRGHLAADRPRLRGEAPPHRLKQTQTRKHNNINLHKHIYIYIYIYLLACGKRFRLYY